MQITPRVHLLRIPFRIPTGPGTGVDRFVNAFVVLGTRTWLIDTGVAGSQAALLALVAELGRAPETIEHILLTHGHVDHIGAARALCDVTGASVHAHPAERHWIETIETQARERPVPGFHGLVGGDVAIHHLLSDGQRLELAPELHLRVLHCPGHSPGSTCFFLEEDGLLFSGDVVPLPGDMPVYDDPLLSLQSLRRLQSLSDLRGLLSAWDVPRLGDDARTTFDNAIDLIERIHAAIRTVSQTVAPTDPLVFCRAALRELHLPEGMANPLVARTFLAHYLVRDRPSLLG